MDWGHRLLTDRECRTAEASAKDRKLFDGGGLHLLIKPTGYKSWRMKYRFGGKEKQLTFGPYPLLSLKDARTKRDEAKRLLLDDIDPGAVKRAKASIAKQADPGQMFEAAAIRWHDQMKRRWKPRHADEVLRSMRREIFPELGDLPLTKIGRGDIRPIIEEMQKRGSIEQAHRVLRRIHAVFELALVDGTLDETASNPASSLKVLLQPIPRRKYGAITDLRQLTEALDRFEREPHHPVTRLASRLLALTAARPGTIRFAAPGEFRDLDGREPTWIIPAAKLKLEREESEQAGFDFPIPLSRQAVDVVKAALPFAWREDHIFPSPSRARRPISENALNKAYRDNALFGGRHVPHGWRSSFSTIMNERAKELDRPGDREVIDLMLAHKPKGVEAVYNRAAYMKRRRILAQEWADLLTADLMPAEQLLEGPRT
ncbi:MAG: integrase arm-type DNA-binding domain-containing protein [Pontixanthobacter sp.]